MNGAILPGGGLCAQASARSPKTARRRPRSVAEACAALNEVTEQQRFLGDPRAAFSDVYAIITRRVAERVAEGPGFFREPAWISQLAGRFCVRYLEALEAWEDGRGECAAWTETHRYSGRRATLPLQEAVLGLSAHINYDLALGIVDNILAFGHARDERMLSRYKHDHDAVNRILDEAVPEVLRCLGRRHGCRVSALLGTRARPATRWAAMQLLALWRARVWREVRALLTDPDVAARAARVRRMDRRAARLARALTAPSAAYLALRPGAAA